MTLSGGHQGEGIGCYVQTMLAVAGLEVGTLGQGGPPGPVAP